MKRVLRIIALLLLLSALVFWVAKGAHRGWTINNLPHDTPNPVTGLTSTTYEKVFIPGFDFLAVAAVAAAAVTGASFLFSKKNPGT